MGLAVVTWAFTCFSGPHMLGYQAVGALVYMTLYIDMYMYIHTLLQKSYKYFVISDSKKYWAHE